MRSSAFRSKARGAVRRTVEGYGAFFPAPLPRSIEYPHSVVMGLEQAVAAVHRLSGASRLLPNPDLFMGPYLRIEAVLSSRIEGTQTTVNELLRFEAEVAPDDEERNAGPDMQEVRNYRRALDHGMSRLGTLPISLRLIREMHAVLMEGVGSDHHTPGKFRESQNWIGPPGCTLSTATFVPPPHYEMGEPLADLERFLHERDLPVLIALAMAHYQFEAIHPFLDGNGRVGRLLIPLVLAERAVLRWPLLPLSVFFEQHRDRYYELLLSVSADGDFTPWFEFFLTGVAETARDAEDRAVRLVDLQRLMHERLLAARVATSVLRLADHLLGSPYVTAPGVERALGISKPTANKAIHTLEGLGVLTEVSGRERRRVYYAPDIYEAVYGIS